MPVTNLNRESQAAYKIGMGIGWESLFLRIFFFSGTCLCASTSMQHICKMIIPFSAPGGSTCAPEWESGPSGQTGLGNKSSRILDDAA